MSVPASGCAETSYTTPKGLQFSLYCEQDRTSVGDIGNIGADTVEQCLDECALKRGCEAAAFDSNERKCFFKDSRATAVGAVKRTGWTLGVGNSTQFEPIPIQCTNNATNQKAQNGLEFTVYCNQTVSGYDTCPDNDTACRAHTDTLEGCLDVCSTLNSSCTGVAWDPTLMYGYLNCYPKNATAKVFDNARTSSKDGLRTAKALIQVATDDCPAAANGVLVASNKDSFKLSCGEDRVGSDITAQHSGSLASCIDSCATYTNTTCFGAVFDPNMVNGFENCYLKSDAGSMVQRSSFAFALRQNGSNSSSPDTTSDPNSAATRPTQKQHSSSKAWIAGPVIGAIAAIAIIFAAIWWFRRRKRSPVSEMDASEVTQVAGGQDQWAANRHHDPKANPVKHEVPSHPSTMSGATYPVGSELDATLPTYELDTSRQLAEMDSTTRDGHMYSRVGNSAH